MNRIKLTCLASLLISGIAIANTPCDNFQITLKNNLPNDIVLTKVTLKGGDIQPNHLVKLNANSEQVFTVHNTQENVDIIGTFTMNSLSLPPRKGSIGYTLKNKQTACMHDDIPQQTNDFKVEHARTLGTGVKYTLSNLK